MQVLGIDFGGSGIKGALVDTETGELVTERIRIPTPQPANPDLVIPVMKQLAQEFGYNGPIGVGMPSRVLDGIVTSAANIDDAWINYPGQEAIAQATGCPVTLLNDADVAAIAEIHFGAGRGEKGIVMVFTLGTGIGSSMFVHGHLVPNLELGHLYLRGQKLDAEYYASDRIRQEKEMSWKKWGRRLNVYFQHIEFLFSPQLIIIGGGVSKKHAKFLPYLDLRARVTPAVLRNEAGIVGAAVAAITEEN
ncbi:MAG: ROK family protein [Chloroflexota bacterium]|nr:ROK family protein [Anaerolineales bacterium]MCA9976223.1 ROK family protein [Anaerolineales bacterium]